MLSEASKGEFYKYKVLSHPVYDAWWRLGMRLRLAIDATDSAVPNECTIFSISEHHMQDLSVIKNFTDSRVLNKTQMDTMVKDIEKVQSETAVDYGGKLLQIKRDCYKRPEKTILTSCDLSPDEIAVIHECGLQRLIYEIVTYGKDSWVSAYNLLRLFPMSTITHTTSEWFESSREFHHYIFNSWFRIIERARRHMKSNDMNPDAYPDDTPDSELDRYLASDMEDIQSYTISNVLDIDTRAMLFRLLQHTFSQSR